MTFFTVEITHLPFYVGEINSNRTPDRDPDDVLVRRSVCTVTPTPWAAKRKTMKSDTNYKPETEKRTGFDFNTKDPAVVSFSGRRFHLFISTSKLHV